MKTIDIIRLFNTSLTIKRKYDRLINKCFALTKPNYDNQMLSYIYTKYEGTPGETYGLYDHTGAIGLVKHANQMHEFLMPNQREWATLHKIDVVDPLLENEDDQQDYELFLEQINTKLFTLLQAHDSNFNPELNSFLQDMAISTGVLYIGKGTKDKPFSKCKHIPLWEVSFLPDENNKARDVFWIKYTYVRNLKVKYKDNPSIIRQLNKYYDDFKHIKIMECFIRDEDKTTQYTIAGLDRGYITLETIEHKVSPIIVARLNANANDVYGTGEIMLAISLIERANKIKGFIAKQLNSDFLGIKIINKERITNINTYKQDGVLYIDGADTDPSKIIYNPPFDYLKIEEYLGLKEIQEQITEYLLFRPFGLDNFGKATKYELQRREALFSQEQSGSYGRLANEGVEPILTLALHRANEVGAFNPTDDPNVQKYLDEMFSDNQGQYFSKRYKSPLSSVDDNENVERALSLLEYMQKIDPMLITSNISKDRLIDYLIDQMHVTHSIKYTDKEKKQLAEQIKQRLDEQQGNNEEETQPTNQSLS